MSLYSGFCSIPFRSVFFPLFCKGREDVIALSPLFQGGFGVSGAKSSYSMGEGQGTTWMSCQLIAGPLLMAEAARGVPTAHQEQFWGSVSCSRILRHVAIQDFVLKSNLLDCFITAESHTAEHLAYKLDKVTQEWGSCN